MKELAQSEEVGNPSCGPLYSQITAPTVQSLTTIGQNR
jgi:hypothetical protein